MQFSKTFSKSWVAQKYKIRQYGLPDKEDNTDKSEDLKSAEGIQYCPQNKYTYITVISFLFLRWLKH